MAKTNALLAMLLATSLLSKQLEAQENDNNDYDEQVAVEEFNRGNELFANEQFAEAARAFRTAYAAKPSWKLWYNIGQSEVAATHYGAGLVAFESYLAQGGDLVPAERQQEVLAELERLRALVGSLDVDAEANCQVRINGDVRGTTPLSGLIKVAAGITNEVEIVKDGKVIFSQSIRLSGGDIRTVRVPQNPAPTAQATPEMMVPPPALPPVAAAETPTEVKVPAPPHESPAPATSKAIKVGAGVLLGTGIAALIAGGVTGVLAFNKSSELENDCPNNTCAESRSVDDMYTSKSLGTASTILTAAGAAIVATGVILLIFNKKRDRESATQLAPTSRLSTRFLVLQLEGRF